MPAPAPETENTPLAKLELPVTPTEPTSAFDQLEGSGRMTAVTVRLIVVVLVKPSDEPVTVTVTEPVVAELLAVRVKALAVVVALGLNSAVTPLGRLETAKLIVPLKPPCKVTVMVLVALDPCGMVKLLGDAEREKLPCGFMVSEMVAVFVKLPEVPVMVTGKVPTAAVLTAVKVSVLVVAVLLGLKEAVTPLGRPEADNVTALLKPFCGVTVMVFVPVAPCVIVTLLKEVDSEKLGAGGAGRVTETLSKVAVAREDVVRLLTANPMYKFGAMVTV